MGRQQLFVHFLSWGRVAVAGILAIFAHILAQICHSILASIFAHIGLNIRPHQPIFATILASISTYIGLYNYAYQPKFRLDIGHNFCQYCPANLSPKQPYGLSACRLGRNFCLNIKSPTLACSGLKYLTTIWPKSFRLKHFWLRLSWKFVVREFVTLAGILAIFGIHLSPYIRPHWPKKFARYWP